MFIYIYRVLIQKRKKPPPFLEEAFVELAYQPPTLNLEK